MGQTRIANTDPDPVYLRYKEVQGTEITERTLDSEVRARNVLDVIKGLDRQTKSSSVEFDLDLDANPDMWVSHLLENYPDPPEVFDSSLINNFCDSLYTSARKPGKYAILIVVANSVIICHTDSKEKTITTEADVLERLLDTDNVDKYVRFKRERDGLTAYHFERNQNTKSFSEWLGLQPEEIAFEEAGDIKIYTHQKDATSIFQYSRDEFVHKFLLEESHTLVSDILRFPDGDEFPVNQVKLGRRSYETVDEFLQTFYNIYYDLQTYRTKYADLTESLGLWNGGITDYNSKVTRGLDSEILLKKEHDRLNIIFADNFIDLSAGWRLELLSNFISGDKTRLYHVGSGFTEEPQTIGPFLIYNKASGDFERLNELYDIISNFNTGDTMANIISHVIFDTAAEWFDGPEAHFFDQLGEKCVENLDAEGVVIPEEGNIIEYKSRDWFSGIDNDELADKITKEIQNDTTLLIGGIEDQQTIRPLSRNRFDPDRDNDIRETLLSKNGNHSTINFSTLPVREDECLTVVFSIKSDMETDFSFIETPS
ncbi:hypothetical protein C491_15657 [Natronococcus amylolyticus DSM 10524]|uniref:Uncharacterized protein n=1 Tax=Natronococcus amylolyticus DSM 10524 TaxID=1227497 RepID=L9X2D5_9EURY|nr:hypothetical protein [Natronococcus amylolyticus]ELY55616.1 hypothetical protein C491_15657 [Natronococcus amylolyticus DSM 10524]